MSVNRTAVSTSSGRLTWTLALLSVALVVGGCAATADHAITHPDYSRSTITTTEYEAEAATLTLAPGWSWPDHPIPPTYRGVEIRYEQGYGTQAADQYWFCSWATRALRSRPHTAERHEAVRLLESLRTTFYYSVLNAHSKPYVDRELRRAARGELAMVRTDVHANCQEDE